MFDTTHAACKGQQEIFFSERSKRKQATAKSICGKCPLREECADWAIKNHIHHGIWGGYNAKEIMQLRRDREIVLPPHYSRNYGYIIKKERNA